MIITSESCLHTFRNHIEKYTELSEYESAYISSFFSIKKVRKKDLLLKPDTICRYESFIISGLFQTSYLDELGKIHTLNFPHEDWWVGDFKSFSNRVPTEMKIEALEDSVLLEISKSSLDELLAKSLPFAKYFRALSENASIAANDRIVNQLSKSAEQRYDLFCMKYQNVLKRLSQKKIASFLGVSPEYLNQIKKKKIINP